MHDRLGQMLSGETSDELQDGEPGASDSEIRVHAYCTGAVVPELSFPHRACRRWALPDAAAASHLKKLEAYVTSRDPPQMTQQKFHVLQHIQRVRHHLGFIFEQQHKAAVSAWATAANAILFVPDGSIRDPQWRTLVPAPDGVLGPGAEVPYPADAQARKARSESMLAQKGMRTLRHLPPVVSELEVDLRPAHEVATRAMAILMAATRAESIAAGQPLPLERLRAHFPTDLVALSPKEAQFIGQDNPERQDTVNFCWRYECVYLLEWALGLVPGLPFPEDICDVPLTAKTLLERPPLEILQQAKLRDAAEILDALDLHYRLNWCSRDARRQGNSVPGLDGGVVVERHRALNWLVRFGHKDWDQVDTPT